MNTAQNPRLFVSQLSRINDIESDKILTHNQIKNSLLRQNVFVGMQVVRYEAPGIEPGFTAGVWKTVWSAIDLCFVCASSCGWKMRKGEMCVPHGINGVYTCRYSTGKTHRALWRLFNQHSASGLRKEDSKMKNIKNPNCPSWIRTNKCKILDINRGNGNRTHECRSQNPMC